MSLKNRIVAEHMTNTDIDFLRVIKAYTFHPVICWVFLDLKQPFAGAKLG